jgi:hypothetical protein
VLRERYAVLVREGSAPRSAPACGLPGLFAPGGASTLHARLVERISQAPVDSDDDVVVVLAEIAFPASPDDALTPALIDPGPRPLIYGNPLLFELLLCLAEQGQPAATVTSIDALSWMHGGHLSIAAFVDPAGGLTLGLSAALQAASVPAEGRAWFKVSVEYPVLTAARARTPQPGTTLHAQRVAGSVTLAGDAKSITFRPAGGFAETFQSTLEALAVPPDVSPLCRVSINCDALLDEGGQPIGGHFPGGVLPTSRQRGGGWFESWFLLDRQGNA